MPAAAGCSPASSMSSSSTARSRPAASIRWGPSTTRSSRCRSSSSRRAAWSVWSSWAGAAIAWAGAARAAVTVPLAATLCALVTFYPVYGALPARQRGPDPCPYELLAERGIDRALVFVHSSARALRLAVFLGLLPAEQLPRPHRSDPLRELPRPGEEHGADAALPGSSRLLDGNAGGQVRPPAGTLGADAALETQTRFEGRSGRPEESSRLSPIGGE